MTNKRLRWVLPMLGLIGMGDAGFLTWEFYTQNGRLVPCGLNGGCNVVLQSSFSDIAGIPVSLFGLLFYFSVLILSLYWILEHEKAIHVLMMLTTAGFCVSLYLLYLQGYVIGAWCQYCLLSAGLSILLWIASLIFFRAYHRESQPPASS